MIEVRDICEGLASGCGVTLFESGRAIGKIVEASSKKKTMFVTSTYFPCNETSYPFDVEFKNTLDEAKDWLIQKWESFKNDIYQTRVQSTEKVEEENETLPKGESPSEAKAYVEDVEFFKCLIDSKTKEYVQYLKMNPNCGYLRFGGTIPKLRPLGFDLQEYRAYLEQGGLAGGTTFEDVEEVIVEVRISKHDGQGV